jgi:tetratricopeptide (TPR) repeat protein
MKKLNSQLLAGSTAALIIYGIFFCCQIGFAQNYDNNLVARADSVNHQALLRLNNQLAQSLVLKTEVLERYVEASQRNLDMWLKILALIISVLIGLFVIYGIRMRETNRDELLEIRRIKDDIKKLADEVEDRLKSVRAQVAQSERADTKESDHIEKISQQLTELGNKTDQLQTIADKKIIEESISDSKVVLQHNGVESLKNLYMARSLKAIGNRKWEEAIRLLSSYIDFDEKNHQAIFNRGLAHLEFSKSVDEVRRVEFVNKSIIDSSEVIRLQPDNPYAFNNRGVAFTLIGEHAKAVADFNEAINLLPGTPLFYYSRAATYAKMGMESYAEVDVTKAHELEASITTATRI